MNEKIQNILMLGVLLVCSYVLYLMLCGNDNERGTEQLRNEITQVGDTNRAIADGIVEFEQGITVVEERISGSESRIDSAIQTSELLERNISEAGELVRECQRIVEEVRSRSKEGTPQT